MIHVEDTEDTNVKSDAGIRKVPVHPRLIKLGFIEYIAKQKRSQKRPFLFIFATKWFQ